MDAGRVLWMGGVEVMERDDLDELKQWIIDVKLKMWFGGRVVK